MKYLKTFQFFSIFIVHFLIIQFSNCQEVVDPSYCDTGCSLCQSSQLNVYNCRECKNDFKLDQSINKCIYQQCKQNLFFSNSDTNYQSLQCVAICQNSYFGNKQTNICEEMQECSTLFASSNQLFTKTQVIESHQLNEKSIIVLYKGVYTLIDIQSGKIQKTVNFDDDIMLVKVIKGRTFLMDNNNKLYQWNVNLEYKQLIIDLAQITNIAFSSRNNLIEIEQRYVCIMIVDQANKQIQLQIIYDIQTEREIKINNNQIIQDGSELSIIGNLIITSKESNLIIQEITFQGNLLVEQICQINTASIQKNQIYDQNDNILAIKINKKEILLINKLQKTCKQLTFQLIIDSIQSVKVRQDNNDLLIIKEDNLILKYKIDSNSIQQIDLNLELSEHIQDIQIAYIQSKVPELIILTNFNNIYTGNIDNQTNQIQFTKIHLQMNDVIYIIKTIPLNQTYSYQLGILLSSLESLTILKRNSITQKIEQNVLINYIMPFPVLLGKIKKLIIIQAYSYIALCTESGYIQIFDISSGYEARLIQTFNINSGQCIDIQNILSERIIAIFSSQIVIINLFTCSYERNIEFKIQQKNNPSISVNGIYTILSFNECIQLYQNSQLDKVLFESCDDIFKQSIQGIFLSQNLVLYLVLENKIKSVQIDLTQKNVKVLNVFEFLGGQSIIFYDILKNEYYIDEILVFDSEQTFSIFNKNLVQTHSLLIPKIKKPDMIKRAANDSSFYALIESIVENLSQNCRILAFTKSQTLEVIWNFQGVYNSPIILSPIKFINKNNIEQFLIRQYCIYEQFTLSIDYIVQPSTKKTYGQGFQGLYNSNLNYQQAILDQDNQKSIIYAGSDLGLLQQFNVNFSIYQVVEVSKYFKNQADEIIQFINFQVLEKYYLLLKSYILIFNAFTDVYESTIEINQQYTQNPKISIIKKKNLLVYSCKNFIFIRNYASKSIYSDYVYNTQPLINDWIFDEKESQFYVYGQGFNCLDIQLKLKKEIISKEYTLEICLINETTLIIIDKLNPNIQSTIEVQGFTQSKFILSIDSQYSAIYLVETYVQVYTILGAYTTQIQGFQTGNLKSIDFQDNYLILYSLACKNLDFIIQIFHLKKQI